MGFLNELRPLFLFNTRTGFPRLLSDIHSTRPNPLQCRSDQIQHGTRALTDLLP
jgi:hypothetical protein